MIELTDIQSLADFQRSAEEYVKRIKETRSPLVLTVNGEAALVVRDLDSYQEMLERLDRIEAVEAIQRAVEEFEKGQGRSAREALEELRQKHVEVVPCPTDTA